MGEKLVGSAGVSTPGSQGRSQGVGQPGFLPEGSRGEAASMLTWILGAFPFHIVVRPRSLFSCGFFLAVRGCPHAQACDLSSSSESATARIVLSNRLASFHKSFVRLNEEIKSYLDKSGAMRLNILVLLMADLFMALRYITVEISILPVFCFCFVFSSEAKVVNSV